MLQDFLMQCFQKDPNLRISAKKILRHPWLQRAARQVRYVAANTMLTDQHDSMASRNSQIHRTEEEKVEVYISQILVVLEFKLGAFHQK
jgi:hypothetical protein